MAIPIALWFLPLHLDPKAQHAISISLFMILAWAIEVMDHGLTGLIGCYLFWALGVVKFDVAFSGFADDTPWFLMGAILFGTMASKSGLAKRLAYMVAIRVGTSYSRLLLGLIISDFLLTPLVPSGMARVTIMAAIAMGLIGVFGLGPGSNVGRGMFLILTYTAGVFDKSIIAGASAITGRGIIESAGHVQVLWSQWLVAYLPSDIVTILVAWRLTLWLYPPEVASLWRNRASRGRTAQSGPLDAAREKIAGADVDRGRVLGHRFSASHSFLDDRAGDRTAGRAAVCGHPRHRRCEESEFPAIVLCRRRSGHGEGAHGVTRSGGADQHRVRLARATVDAPVSFHLCAVLDRLCVPLVPGQRNFHAGHVHAAAHAVCHHTWIERTQAGNAVGVFFRWQDFVYQSGVLVLGYAYGYFRARDILRLGLIMSLVDSLLLLIVVPFYWPLIGIR